MKNLHKITPYLSEEDKRVIAGFYRNAYIPGSNRKIKIINGKAYYFPYNQQTELKEWNDENWRRYWTRQSETFLPTMVIME